jgi:hypothetical protein
MRKGKETYALDDSGLCSKWVVPNGKERKLGLSKRMDGEVVFGVGGKGGALASSIRTQHK